MTNDNIYHFKLPNESCEINFEEITRPTHFNKTIIISQPPEGTEGDNTIYAVEEYAIILKGKNGFEYHWAIGENEITDFKKFIKAALKDV